MRSTCTRTWGRLWVRDRVGFATGVEERRVAACLVCYVIDLLVVEGSGRCKWDGVEIFALCVWNKTPHCFEIFVSVVYLGMSDCILPFSFDLRIFHICTAIHWTRVCHVVIAYCNGVFLHAVIWLWKCTSWSLNESINYWMTDNLKSGLRHLVRLNIICLILSVSDPFGLCRYWTHHDREASGTSQWCGMVMEEPQHSEMFWWSQHAVQFNVLIMPSSYVGLLGLSVEQCMRRMRSGSLWQS